MTKLPDPPKLGIAFTSQEAVMKYAKAMDHLNKFGAMEDHLALAVAMSLVASVMEASADEPFNLAGPVSAQLLHYAAQLKHHRQHIERMEATATAAAAAMASMEVAGNG